MTTTEKRDHPPRHPIQVVSTRTGLSKDVIRIWERRYQAISPERTETGRRVYADADISRLLKLKMAMARGWRIGEIAQLSDSELEEMLASDSALEKNGPEIIPDPGPEGVYLERCLSAIETMDPVKLGSILASASVAMTLPLLLERLVAPLMTEIGRRWHTGRLRIGHEHMASSVIRSFLDNLRESANMQADGPTILVTTPSGQNHEMGALMAAVAAGAAGWRTIYLSPNLPAQDIVAAATQVEARAVALSLVYPADDPRIEGQLRFIADYLPSNTRMIVGGQAAASYSQLLAELGVRRLNAFDDLVDILIELRSEPTIAGQ